MKKSTFWTGIATAATVATGLTVWAVHSPSAGPSESKSVSVARDTKSVPNSVPKSVTKSVDVLLQSALKRQTHQDFVGAAEDYRRILEADPKNKQAWYGIGVIDQAYGRTAEARKDYDKALETDPRFTSALFSEAFMLRSSDPDRAVELLRRAAAIQPKAATVQLQLGQLLADRNRDGEAEQAFRRAVAADGRLLSRVPEEFRDAVSR
ncbi:Tetratricopeptide repeat-containing protein [Streptomyces sp. 1222.5]|uniref:tetratricopeptide repeat protein n=1 Tax=unclassified Streptomyces TaxID=2593676 RepID=UPI000899E58F|nr:MULTISPECIES: tetratricopeptide repeat protein [unclassified Streptomyces]PKW09737.1 tetratricopeptide repeat protein [Streptomyces sp. 5112.2]SEC26336.1 Tetratricopeptide repeat-containing protein [Streptomyces sp. 1222.5]